MADERVAKLMAARGLCSRREAERLIDAGAVLVDGVVVRAQGAKAAADADIQISGAGRTLLGDRFTVVLHKPVGVVSTQPEPGQTEAWELLRPANAHRGVPAALVGRVTADPSTFAVAGRLDRASRGLLVLTQDGTVARRIIGGEGVEKEYLVRTSDTATDGQIRRLNGPLELDDQPLLPMRVERVDDETLRFVLVEGKKHQIRRLCRRFGLTVVDLFRTAIGPLWIGDLREGRWRVVAAEELEHLRREGRVRSSRAAGTQPRSDGSRPPATPSGDRRGRR